ncbi:MAG: uracil-DNA glycosylase family protein [Acidimicrobiales bacterium]
MDRETVDVYEADIEVYLRRPLAVAAGTAAFAAAVPDGLLRLDLGCGPGHMTGALGTPVLAADAAWSMLSRVEATPLRVQADLEALPIRAGAIHGTWASKCLQHVPADHLPRVLADLHRSTALGGRLELVVPEGEGTWRSGRDNDLPGRNFWNWPRARLLDVIAGAGFTEAHLEATDRTDRMELHVTATRGRTLPDTVGPGMRLLVCGLNPSLLSADVGVGFARPGNRFWPAAIAAGLASRARDPRHALEHHGTGMTNLVQRASVSAVELTGEEYADGLGRVERLCRWLQPAAVCFVGLAGWRAAVDRRAVAGVQAEPLGGVPVYVMPNTSGLNAHTLPADHAEHLRAAAALADRR